MSKDSRRKFIIYDANVKSALVITLLSLFCQWANWFVYEKLDYAWGFTLVTPLILCLMYHFIQQDSGRNGNFSRRFFFIFSVIVPLAFGVVLTVIMLISSPDISNFDPDAEYKGTVRETIATYAGRFIFTSLYLLVFAGIDRIIFSLRKRKEK